MESTMPESRPYVSPTTKKEVVAPEDRCMVMLTTGLHGRRCAQKYGAILTNPNVKEPQKVCLKHLAHFKTPIWTIKMVDQTDRGAG
jgi:hypothetical protein